MSRNVAKGSSASHTARVFVMSRRVAKISSDFRFSNTEVKSTLLECALRVAVWRKSHPTFDLQGR